MPPPNDEPPNDEPLNDEPPNDDWSTRHSVRATARRTVDLVNVLCRDRPGPDPETVARVLRAHGESVPRPLTAQDIGELRSAAQLLRQVFAAPDTEGAARALNSLLRRTAGAVRLTSHHGTSPWHPHLDSDDEAPWGEWFLASSCLALTVLLWDRQRPPGGLCTSPSCTDVYLTQSGGPPRRYCSRRCATRERVAAHRRSRS